MPTEAIKENLLHQVYPWKGLTAVDCNGTGEIIVYCACDLVDIDLEAFATDRLIFIGEALHAIQQGQVEFLTIHGYKVSAIRMDQTAGAVDGNDIFKTDHPERPFQRLIDILANDFTL